MARRASRCNRCDIRRDLVEVLSTRFLSTGGIDTYDGRHSPVYRDLSGLPPLLVQAAGRDVCHDDSIRLAANARAAGVSVTTTEYPDAEHVWILNGPWRIRYGGDRFPDDGMTWVDSRAEAPEAVTALDEMCRFVKAHLHPARVDHGLRVNWLEAEPCAPHTASRTFVLRRQRGR